MLQEIISFNSRPHKLLACSERQRITLGGLLDEQGYSNAFRQGYLLPMAAAIWSSSPSEILDFPAAMWGMIVYDAALYAPQGTYRPDYPHSLEITYRFSFSREQLADKSLEEIERLFGKRSNRDALLAQFRSIFPDVTRGDRIIALHYPGKRADFYHGDQPLGQIESAGLAAEFFSIWLDPETGGPDLRSQLLGIRTVLTGPE